MTLIIVHPNGREEPVILDVLPRVDEVIGLHVDAEGGLGAPGGPVVECTVEAVLHVPGECIRVAVSWPAEVPGGDFDGAGFDDASLRAIDPLLLTEIHEADYAAAVALLDASGDPRCGRVAHSLLALIAAFHDAQPHSEDDPDADER